ncbi:hypothetical protein SUGI_1001490 [Cryptomeria japonica]|nr:hypothetical protein SUGI_1001490 [Cryptomeria japonica]
MPSLKVDVAHSAPNWDRDGYPMEPSATHFPARLAGNRENDAGENEVCIKCSYAKVVWMCSMNRGREFQS